MNKVLIIEDEVSIREMLAFVLEQNGYHPLQAGSFQEAKEHLNVPYPSTVLLDWMLPDEDGIQIAKQLKQDEKTQHIPIIMLTARDEEEDKIKGLEVGADDYMTKPFSPKELIARIRAVHRRTMPSEIEDPIVEDGVLLDPVSHRVKVMGNPVDLGPTKFKLLHFFMTNPDRVYSREQLIAHVWDTNVYVENRTVDVQIRRLRKAIGKKSKMIQTVRGSGYRFSRVA
ncbi:MAG: phosphate regulon transcriptional regulator PhoB [Gammaproteobacteria bacterium]|nr:phosphate regulon transcriptional regulator PhoB [Gammaproteobacteria bacterium]